MKMDETMNLFKTHDILNIEELLDCQRELVTYDIVPNEQKCQESGVDYQLLLDKLDNRGFKNQYISVAIASATTAYARIHMNKLKHIDGLAVLYTDTDSIVTTTPIDPKYVGTALGQLKLETEIVEGIFVAPKLYYIESTDKSKSKAKGVGSLLTKEDFLRLLQEESVTSTKTY